MEFEYYEHVMIFILKFNSFPTKGQYMYRKKTPQFTKGSSVYHNTNFKPPGMIFV